MQTVDVLFGEWLPSAPDYNNPGCIVADGVIPQPGGYGPLPSLLSENQSVAGDCRGAAQFFTVGGTAKVYGGTATSLFTMSGTATATTGLVDIGDGSSWSFARFNDIVVATAPNNAPQYLDDMDTDTTWSALPGSPPQARYCARVADFLMLGNIAGAENRIQWSRFNNPSGAWGTDRRAQSGYADLPRDLGGIMGMVGGRYPLVFQEFGVNALQYVGPPVVWRRTTVEQARGCIAPFSIVQVGFTTYYLATDGFYATDGSSFQPISTNKITRWFFNEADPDMLSRVHGAVDFQNECVFWAFHTSESDVFSRLLIYSWSQNRWSSATVNLNRLVDVKVGAMTLEEIGALYASVEAVPTSFDDPRWKGRARGMGAFLDDGTNTTLHHFRGLPVAARFETGEFQPQPGRRVMVGRAWPILDDDEQASSVAVVPFQNDRSSAYTALSAIGADGSAPLRADGRSMRAVLSIPADTTWRDAQGMQVQFRVTGRR